MRKIAYCYFGSIKSIVLAATVYCLYTGDGMFNVIRTAESNFLHIYWRALYVIFLPHINMFPPNQHIWYVLSNISSPAVQFGKDIQNANILNEKSF